MNSWIRAAATTALLTATAASGFTRVGGVFGTSLMQVEAKNTNTCAVTSTQTVECWGDNSSGQLGIGSFGGAIAVPGAVTNVSGAFAVAIGGYHACAIVGNGAVKCWGGGGSGQLGNSNTNDQNLPVDVPPFGFPGISVAALTAGVQHTCALVAQSGGVYCWGLNDDGQIGMGSYDPVHAPYAVAGLTSGITSISAGFYHTCAATAYGQVQCWGNNSAGQLGIGNKNGSNVPVNVAGLRHVKSIAAGRYHTCALTGGGVWCWGDNTYGQLGTGNFDPSSTPVRVNGLADRPIALSTGGDTSCAVLINGNVQCWGLNNVGQIGNFQPGTNAKSPEAVVDLAGKALTVSAGGSHTCVLLAMGGAQCWGGNGWGNLGNSSFDTAYRPVSVRGHIPLDVAKVATGGQFTCITTAIGSIWCWGLGDQGQLGNDSFHSSAAPVPVKYIDDHYTNLTASFTTACANAGPGSQWACWGHDQYGGLNDGATANSAVPKFTDSDQLAAAPGFNHTCQLLPSGAVQCVGYGLAGQLGNSSSMSSPTMVDVTGLGSGVAAIASSTDHTCALKAVGGIACWGLGTSGQLGDGNPTSRNSPVTVIGLTTTHKNVSAGGNHTCAVTSAGATWCWGANAWGQLGNGGTSPSSAPQTVSGLPTAAMVSAGTEFTCALTTAGAVLCWGVDGVGQLGNNPLDPANSRSVFPTAVYGLSDGVTAISAGASHACALTERGSLMCWGNNDSGQLGDSGYNASTAPVVTIAGAQAIAFNPPPTIDINTEATPVSATSSSGLTVDLQGWTNTCGVVDGQIHDGQLTYGGLCGLRAVQAGSDDVAPAVAQVRLIPFSEALFADDFD